MESEKKRESAYRWFQLQDWGITFRLPDSLETSSDNDRDFNF